MARKLSPQARGQGAVALTAVLWSTSGLFIKLVDWHPALISGARSLGAFLFLLAARAAFPPERTAADKGGAGALLAGGFAYAFAMLIFVAANKLTASANVIMLQYSAPVWAALLGWALLGEKPRVEHWAALVFVGAGFALFFRDGLASGGLRGDALAVLSGVCFGAASVALRMMKTGNPRDALLLSQGITFVFCAPFFFLAPPRVTAQDILALLFMGVVQMGCASLLFSYGIKRVPAVQAMLTAMIEPVLNPVWVLAATGEKPSAAALAGGVIIIAAVAGSSVISRKREEALAQGRE